ncbi:hypothetical protein V494_07012 [Pseudogymnoascus sp. VKM F-4513 (FW-928)]|nr:hypothetical protein V494_07012 [Pseudogymnoascus sp. VKM F-4513 (FW-928)]
MQIKSERQKEIPRAPSPSLWAALAAKITETSARWGGTMGGGQEAENSKDQSQMMVVSKRGGARAGQAV